MISGHTDSLKQFMHSFKKYLLYIYYVPSNVPVYWDTVVNKSDEIPTLTS